MKGMVPDRRQGVVQQWPQHPQPQLEERRCWELGHQRRVTSRCGLLGGMQPPRCGIAPSAASAHSWRAAWVVGSHLFVFPGNAHFPSGIQVSPTLTGPQAEPRQDYVGNAYTEGPSFPSSLGVHVHHQRTGKFNMSGITGTGASSTWRPTRLGPPTQPPPHRAVGSAAQRPVDHPGCGYRTVPAAGLSAPAGRGWGGGQYSAD